MRFTNEEKAALVSGTNFMETNPIPKKNVPSLVMADGPHGLRKQTGGGDNGMNISLGSANRSLSVRAPSPGSFLPWFS